jgi:hypothetical protein
MSDLALTTEAKAPWKTLGVSRACWFKRKRDPGFLVSLAITSDLGGPAGLSEAQVIFIERAASLTAWRPRLRASC